MVCAFRLVLNVLRGISVYLFCSYCATVESAVLNYNWGNSTRRCVVKKVC